MASTTSMLFMSSLAILITFNIIVGISALTDATFFIIDDFISLLVAIIPVVAIAGATVLGSGLNSVSIKILLGIATMLSILFSIDLPAPFPDIGLGLGTNVLDMFPVGSVGSIPFAIVSGLMIIAFMSGVVMIVESS